MSYRLQLNLGRDNNHGFGFIVNVLCSQYTLSFNRERNNEGDENGKRDNEAIDSSQGTDR